MFILTGLFRLFARVWGYIADHLRLWLTPTYRFGVSDDQIERLTAWRAWLGIVTVAYVNVVWTEDVFSYVSNSLSAWITSLVTGTLTIGGLLLLSSLFLIVVADGPSRAQTLKDLLVPLRTVFGVVVFAGALAAIVGLTAELTPGATETGSSLGVIFTLLLVMVAWLALLIAIAAGLFIGARLLIHHYFRAVDGHPTLRAITAIAVSLSALVTGFVQLGANDTGERVPVGWSVLFLFGGPLVTMAISVWELYRLNRYWNITVRWSPP